MKLFLGVVLAISCAFAFKNSDDYINEINSKQNLWKAGRNFPEDIPLSDIQGLLGAKKLSQDQLKSVPIMNNEIDETVELPKSFDSRTQWPKCKTIKQIADQSDCGSCWAVSVTSAISDRICIHSEGKHQPQISARNLMACEDLSGGCKGGYPLNGWFYWRYSGLVTGGPYGSKIGCQPYPFPPCEHHATGNKTECPEDGYKTPKCIEACDNTAIDYKKDLIYGGKSYLMYEANETKIQQEIFKNGPVVATFTVYTDFMHYKSGVYVNTTDHVEGLHAVRMIGWGEENDTRYWLVANSWNEDWGDKGLFKIRRGTNECGIEDEVTAGLPKNEEF